MGQRNDDGTGFIKLSSHLRMKTDAMGGRWFGRVRESVFVA